MSNIVYPKLALYKKKPYPEVTKAETKRQVVDIVVISIVGMYYNIQVKENKAFTTSLYEIDRLLQERQETQASTTQGESEDWEEAIKRVLPEEY